LLPVSTVHNDVTAFLEQKNHLLLTLAKVENEDLGKKKHIITRLVEVTEPVLTAGVIEGYGTKDLSRYLWNEVVKYDIKISHQYFITCIPDNLKRKYPEMNVSSSHEHDFVKSGTLEDGTIIRRCVCDAVEINGQAFISEAEPPKEIEDDAKTVAKDLSYEEQRAQHQKSPILLSIFITKNYLNVCYKFIKAFEEKCKNPQILTDFEKDLQFKEVTPMLHKLEKLYYDHPEFSEGEAKPGGGTPTILSQMIAETNFRAPATILQKAMCATLGMMSTYRQWAHKLSVSPRQHQRIRQRLDIWPDKKAATIIRNVLGSHQCPNCQFNLITRKMPPKKRLVIPSKNQPVKPTEIHGNPLEQLYREFSRKIPHKLLVKYAPVSKKT